MDPLRKVQAGEPFAPSATRDNLITDVVKQFQSQRRSGSAGQGSGGVSIQVLMLSAAGSSLGWYEMKPIIWKQTVSISANATLASLIDTTLTNAQAAVPAIATREIDSTLAAAAMSASDAPVLFIATRTPLMSTESTPRSVWFFDGRQPFVCDESSASP